MSEPAGRAFWLCHECGAQMRPIRIDGVRQCASCNSEFIEILDPEVNPDPAYELPPAPPVRPGSQPPIPTNRPASPPANAAPSITDIFSGMFGGVFGGGGDDQTHPHAGQQAQQAAPDNSPFGRTYQFNIGGGSGSVTFGSFGGGGGGGGGPTGGLDGMFAQFGQPPGQGGRTVGGGGFGPFGPVPEHGGDQGGGLDAFFPGFPPPPPGHGQGQGQGRTTGGQHPPVVALQGGDLFQILRSVLGNEGVGVANVGDYATSDQGFAQILEQLMQATGPQGPLPATDAVIEGLPRLKLDADAIEKSPFKDCPVCKDDYMPDDEVMRVPCQHIFHVDCLQPWLKTNGSCPVCRFSLIPDEGNNNRAAASQSPPQDQQTGPRTAPSPNPPVTGPSGITNILHRLWGQSGSASQPTSPTTENPPQTPPTGVSGSGGTPIYQPPATPPPGSTAQAEEIFYTPPTSLPPGLEERERLEAQARDRADTRARNGDVERAQSRVQMRASGQEEERSSASGQAEDRLPTSIPEDYRERHRQRELEANRQRDREQSQQRDNDPYLDDLD